MRLVIKGLASSQVILELTIPKENEHENLMGILQRHNIPIASSCIGRGHCQKCVVNQDIMSCQISPFELSNQSSPTQDIIITIDYL